MNALACDLFERLCEASVSTVYVGDLTGILDTHWSVETHADLDASRRFLRTEIGSMARPVRFEWDDHTWSELPRSHRPKEQRTNLKVASVEPSGSTTRSRA